MKQRVLIKGAGEHSSGTAHRLFRCGYRVVMTELPVPKAVRRPVSFCTAVIEGEIVVEGVRGVRYTLDQRDMLSAFDWSHVPVFVDPEGELLRWWKPDVVIDGRILKRNLDNSMDQAPLTIGYGPGLFAGRDVHLVVETNRGHDLGRLVEHGLSHPNTGVPGTVKGYNIERVLRGPAHGTLHARAKIGDLVKVGQIIAMVDDHPLVSAIDGVLRGLVVDGSVVTKGQKLGDVDPRGDVSYCTRLSEKTRNISGAALEAIVSFPWS